MLLDLTAFLLLLLVAIGPASTKKPCRSTSTTAPGASSASDSDSSIIEPCDDYDIEITAPPCQAVPCIPVPCYIPTTPPPSSCEVATTEPPECECECATPPPTTTTVCPGDNLDCSLLVNYHACVELGLIAALDCGVLYNKLRCIELGLIAPLSCFYRDFEACVALNLTTNINCVDASSSNFDLIGCLVLGRLDCTNPRWQCVCAAINSGTIPPPTCPGTTTTTALPCQTTTTTTPSSCQSATTDAPCLIVTATAALPIIDESTTESTTTEASTTTEITTTEASTSTAAPETTESPSSSTTTQAAVRMLRQEREGCPQDLAECFIDEIAYETCQALECRDGPACDESLTVFQRCYATSHNPVMECEAQRLFLRLCADLQLVPALQCADATNANPSQLSLCETLQRGERTTACDETPAVQMHFRQLQYCVTIRPHILSTLVNQCDRPLAQLAQDTSLESRRQIAGACRVWRIVELSTSANQSASAELPAFEQVVAHPLFRGDLTESAFFKDQCIWTGLLCSEADMDDNSVEQRLPTTSAAPFFARQLIARSRLALASLFSRKSADSTIAAATTATTRKPSTARAVRQTMAATAKPKAKKTIAKKGNDKTRKETAKKGSRQGEKSTAAPRKPTTTRSAKQNPGQEMEKRMTANSKNDKTVMQSRLSVMRSIGLHRHSPAETLQRHDNANRLQRAVLLSRRLISASRGKGSFFRYEPPVKRRFSVTTQPPQHHFFG